MEQEYYVENSKRSYRIEAYVAGLVMAGVALFMFSAGNVGGFPAIDKAPDTKNNTAIATSKEPPRMMLVVLEGNEDSSRP
jgi:hypothetical protein